MWILNNTLLNNQCVKEEINVLKKEKILWGKWKYKQSTPKLMWCSESTAQRETYSKNKGNNKEMEEIQGIRSWFFGKINKINKL